MIYFQLNPVVNTTLLSPQGGAAGDAFSYGKAASNARSPAASQMPKFRFAGQPLPARNPRLRVLGAVLALHILLVICLFSFNKIVQPAPVALLMVQLHAIAASPPTISQLSPAPLPMVNKRLTSPVLFALQVQPLPLAPTEAVVTPSPAATVSAPQNSVAAPAPLAVLTTAAAVASATEPRFDADYLANPAPSYPPLSRKTGEEGRVVLRVLVDVFGLAAKVEIESSSGFARLDSAAVAAVTRWRFVPAKRGDEAVSATVLVPLVFSLKNTKIY